MRKNNNDNVLLELKIKKIWFILKIYIYIWLYATTQFSNLIFLVILLKDVSWEWRVSNNGTPTEEILQSQIQMTW